MQLAHIRLESREFLEFSASMFKPRQGPIWQSMKLRRRMVKAYMKFMKFNISRKFSKRSTQYLRSHTQILGFFRFPCQALLLKQAPNSTE